MAEETVAHSENRGSVTEELDAIAAEFIRGISLLRVLTRAGADMDDAELEQSLKIAAEHLNGAHNLLDCALLRVHREQRT